MRQEKRRKKSISEAIWEQIISISVLFHQNCCFSFFIVFLSSLSVHSGVVGVTVPKFASPAVGACVPVIGNKNLIKVAPQSERQQNASSFFSAFNEAF
jgi:hypothetical protein